MENRAATKSESPRANWWLELGSKDLGPRAGTVPCVGELGLRPPRQPAQKTASGEAEPSQGPTGIEDGQGSEVSG